jgi:vanillate O-demethylase monooxygenase subunit
MSGTREAGDNGLFMRNAWYAGAFVDELKNHPMVSRKILGESVLFYRDSDGTPAAIGNLCPHRFAPP